jgi:hypothetical protein
MALLTQGPNAALFLDGGERRPGEVKFIAVTRLDLRESTNAFACNLRGVNFAHPHR